MSLLALGSGIISYFFQDEIIRLVLESINNHITTRIQVQSANFSMMRKFPNATVEFKNVVINHSKGFDSLSFDSEKRQQMLLAESVFIEMNLFRLLSGDYRITSIEARNGNINLLTAQNGCHNFIFWKTSAQNDEGSPIELENVTLRNVGIYYNYKQTNTVLALHADRANLSGKFSSQRYVMSVDWEGAVKLLSIDNDNYIQDKSLELTGKLDVENKTFTIRNCDLTLAKNKMSVSGGFIIDDVLNLNLRIDGKDMDYTSLTSLAPVAYRQYLNDYPGKGALSFTAAVKGVAGKGKTPQIEAQFSMKKGHITHRQTQIKLSNLSFSGTFTSGELNRRSTSVLNVRNIECTFGGGTLKGSFSLRDFVKPLIVINIAGNTDLKQLHAFIPARTKILSAEGQMSCNMTIAALLNKMSLTKTDDIEKLAIKGAVRFGDASLRFKEPDFRFSQINGTLQIGNNVSTDDLSLILNSNDFKINGNIEHLTPYLINQSKSLSLNATISSQYLCIDSLLFSNAAPTVNNQNIESAALSFPENIDFDTNIEAQKFHYQKFEAERLKARLVYKPTTIEIKSIAFSVMSGNVKGSGVVSNDKAGNLRVYGETTLSQLDVRQLFTTFDNFAQDKLRAEHVAGKLSGELDFVVGWDKKMQLRQNDIFVEGKMDLDGGELINFEPLNNLSTFVALEELQNIRFPKLRTQISIKDRKLTFPGTDVKTSSFDIICQGEHSFDNIYAYRVKILLSELLAAKARKVKRENKENEYLEDDGKRTALYLIITGQGDNFKMSYDKQSAKASVAEDIRNEKQSLKNILKEEFGWFNKDTTITTTTPNDNNNIKSKPKKTRNKDDDEEELKFIFD